MRESIHAGDKGPAVFGASRRRLACIALAALSGAFLSGAAAVLVPATGEETAVNPMRRRSPLASCPAIIATGAWSPWRRRKASSMISAPSSATTPPSRPSGTGGAARKSASPFPMARSSPASPGTMRRWRKVPPLLARRNPMSPCIRRTESSSWSRMPGNMPRPAAGASRNSMTASRRTRPGSPPASPATRPQRRAISSSLATRREMGNAKGESHGKAEPPGPVHQAARHAPAGRHVRPQRRQLR